MRTSRLGDQGTRVDSGQPGGLGGSVGNIPGSGRRSHLGFRVGPLRGRAERALLHTHPLDSTWFSCASGSGSSGSEDVEDEEELGGEATRVPSEIRTIRHDPDHLSRSGESGACEGGGAACFLDTGKVGIHVRGWPL